MTGDSKPASQPNETAKALNLLSTIYRLTLKAFGAKNRNALIFLIVNDTISVVRYDRALLWEFENNSAKLIGISGQTTINATTETAKKLKRLVSELRTLTATQILTTEHFKGETVLWNEYSNSSLAPSILWVPIQIHGKPRIGLWLERWENSQWTPPDADILNSLAAAYALSWERVLPKIPYQLRKNLSWWIPLLITLLLFVIRVPLRIVAPVEVVPKDPIIIAAPLEDVIERINVRPGQIVKKDQVLAEYDKRVALHTLKIAEEELKVSQEDLTRARTLAFKEEKSLAEISVLNAKVKKEQANLALAKYRVSQLLIKSPIEGVAMLENPDEWRGKPVKVGEKIMMVIDPKKTKVRLWIPENDNIPLDFNQPIKVFLNVHPSTEYLAKLTFISNASSLSEKNIASFMAEAFWVEEPQNITPGLKGSAFLYGERVSLFYWIIRKPLATFREWVGI